MHTRSCVRTRMILLYPQVKIMSNRTVIASGQNLYYNVEMFVLSFVLSSEVFMILSCSHISKSFGTDVILNDVSFHIEDYEKAAIVGINGAGKSTLLKIIVGELSADQGDAVLSKGKTLGYLAHLPESQP